MTSICTFGSRNQNLLCFINSVSDGVNLSANNVYNEVQVPLLAFCRDLGNAGISGPLIPDLGGLQNLQYLELYNNSLSGIIPATLGNLTKLVSLDLYGNQLTGRIPSTLGAIGTLRYLRLYENNLTGAIPTSLGNLLNLQELKLQKNALSGSIPSSFGNIKTLQFLKLNENLLSGTVPLEILSLIISGNLTELNIANNDLAGTVRSTGFRVTAIIQDKLKTA